MSMSWSQLRAHIDMMDKKQVNSDVTIQLIPIDEYFAVKDISFSPEDDVLDKAHPFLIVNTEGTNEEGEEKEEQYPEHNKMHLVKERSQAIGEFLEWLQIEQKVVFGEYTDENPDTLFPFSITNSTFLLNLLSLLFLAINFGVL